MTTKDINQALDTLYKNGITHYKKEYQNEDLKFEAIGLAVAEVSSNAIDFVKIAYSALEDWNHHSACAVLDWIFPKLHPMVKEYLPVTDYLVTLEQMQGAIGDRILTVFTNWNVEKSDYDTAKYRVRLVVEKLEDTE